MQRASGQLLPKSHVVPAMHLQGLSTQHSAEDISHYGTHQISEHHNLRTAIPHVSLKMSSTQAAWSWHCSRQAVHMQLIGDILWTSHHIDQYG